MRTLLIFNHPIHLSIPPLPCTIVSRPCALLCCSLWCWNSLLLDPAVGRFSPHLRCPRCTVWDSLRSISWWLCRCLQSPPEFISLLSSEKLEAFWLALIWSLPRWLLFCSSSSSFPKWASSHSLRDSWSPLVLTTCFALCRLLWFHTSLTLFTFSAGLFHFPPFLTFIVGACNPSLFPPLPGSD